MPTHSPEDLDSYYVGEFVGEGGVAITFYEPENDDYSFDPDAEGEPHIDRQVLKGGTHDDVTWGDLASNREAAAIVLRHHLDREPSPDELDTFLALVPMEDGQEWQINSGDIDNEGLER